MLNVIGLGYIGLPTALIFAKSGIEVVGTDLNNELVDKLNRGQVTFKEEGIEELYSAAKENGIKFTTKYQKTDMYIISVPTPYIKENKKLDPKYVNLAVNSVLDVCEKGAIIIIESTITPGTIDNYVRPEIEKRKLKIGEDIHLVHAPERIIPGNMIYELEQNSRTIGADEPEIAEKVKEIYSSFCKGEIILTDIKSAEMSKVVENTFRDINIAFANELAKICDYARMDVYEIIRIANHHPRVNILTPGPGVGGHCISVDPWFLVGDFPEFTKLILSAREVNDSMPLHVLKRIDEIMEENNIKDYSKVGLYGLTYKEDVDDTRESPTLQLLEKSPKEFSENVKIYDPMVTKKIVNNQIEKFDEFINDIDLIVIMANHKHVEKHSEKIKEKLILDTKNINFLKNKYSL